MWFCIQLMYEMFVKKNILKNSEGSDFLFKQIEMKKFLQS